MNCLKKFFLVFHFTCLSFTSYSQNLIDNGDFETYLSLPLNYGDFCLVSGWINPSGCCVLNPNFGTPDYVHKNAAWPVGIPGNGFGTITPHSGNGAVGFTSYGNYGTPPVFREYITKKFNTHLNIGQSYTISFYIARAANPYFKYATNNIGVYFSNLQPVQNGTDVIPVSPQWEYASVFSSSSWTLMTFNIIPTDTFCYMTIGNFRSDAATAKSIINSSASGLYSHYFIDDVSVVSAVPLPVEWLSFDLKQEGKQVKIEWQTASEKNNDYFSVEKSIDLFAFYKIARLSGTDHSSEITSYDVLDENPIPGISYYRIAQTDFDGRITCSEVKSIIFHEAKMNYSAWYKEQKECIYLEIPQGAGKNMIIFLIDANGKQCYKNQISISGSYELETSYLVKGVYTLIIQDDKDLFQKKLLVY